MQVRKDGIDFMNINKYGSVISAYTRAAYEPVRKKENGKPAQNTDKAEFSSASKAGAAAGAKAAVVKTVESFASPERINALKSMIADGSYNISAESVAASILEG